MEGKAASIETYVKSHVKLHHMFMEAVDFGRAVGYYMACLRSGRLQDEKCSDATALPSKVIMSWSRKFFGRVPPGGQLLAHNQLKLG